MSLFFSTDGQIGRGKFWLGSLILLAIWIGLGLLTALITMPLGALGAWIGFAVLLLFLFPYAVLATKRLRDRGRDNVVPWLVAYLAPGIVVNFAQTAGIGFRTDRFGDLAVSTPNALGTVLIGIGFLAFIVAIIDMGILPGKRASG